MRILKYMQDLAERIFLNRSISKKIHDVRNEMTITTTHEQMRTRQLEKDIKETVTYRLGVSAGRITH